jgi:hypothetical protein
MPFNAHAELVLIADEPIAQKHLELAMQLCDVPIDRTDFVIEGRRCIWPLPIELCQHNRVDDVGGQLYYLTTHLYKRREAIAAIRALGCNIHLSLYFNGPTANFYITSSTMKTLGSLEIQLDFRSKTSEVGVNDQ